jgi:hypothetical protein
VSVERLALPISDLLRSRAHWCDPKESVRTAELICTLLRRDPNQEVDNGALFDLDLDAFEDDEWPPT